MRIVSPKAALADAFGTAAEAYHEAADVQREVALSLARRVADLHLAPGRRVLEIGCGTGFLHQALSPHLPGATWLLSDLSPAMVHRARETVGRIASYAVMDGEQIALSPGSVDLICASLAFQWFDDLPKALKTLSEALTPGGIIAFTTLTAASFPEWRRAHDDLGARSAMRAYPEADVLARMAPTGSSLTLTTEAIPRIYRDALDFLHHWKQIGTHMPDPDRHPLTPGTMRKLLRLFEAGMTVTYDVATGILRKD